MRPVVVVGVMLLGMVSLAPQALWAAEPAIGGIAESENSAAATALIKLAAQRYDEGRYDEALSTLKAARATSPRPGILYNIGQVERARHDCVAALEAYRSFLALTPTSDPNHDRALRWQAEMQTCIDEKAAALEGSTTSTAPSIDAKPAVRSEVAQPVLVQTSLRTALPKSPSEGLRAEASGSSALPAYTSARRASVSTVAGVSLLGASAIAAGAALWFALEARRIEHYIQSGDYTPSIFDMRNADGHRAATRAKWFGALGGVLAVSGGAVLLVSRTAVPGGTPVAFVGWGGEF